MKKIAGMAIVMLAGFCTTISAKTIDPLPTAFNYAEALSEMKYWSCTVTSVIKIKGFPDTNYPESFSIEARSNGEAKRKAKSECDDRTKQVNKAAKEKNQPVHAYCKNDASCEE